MPRRRRTTGRLAEGVARSPGEGRTAALSSGAGGVPHTLRGWVLPVSVASVSGTLSAQGASRWPPCFREFGSCGNASAVPGWYAVSPAQA